MREISKRTRMNAGFTLVELSIVMVIIGILVAGLVQGYTLYLKKQQISATANNIKTVNAALQKYQDDNGFYPCPADPTDPMGRATDCSQPAPPGIKVVAGTGGREVRIGVMPMIDLSGNTKLASRSESVDGWNRRLSYAVTQSMALDPTLFVAGSGAITIKDAKSGNTLVTNGNIAILSHGEDGTGAYTAQGQLTAACSGTSKDAENCNDDAIFLSGQRSYAFGADYNDDYVEFNTATAVETTKACPAGSIMRGLKSNGDLICTNEFTCPTGHAVAGILPDGVTPNCQVVTSTCQADEAMVALTLGGAPTCMKNMPGSCPAGYVQDGTERSRDASNFGEARCLQILHTCPANYVQVGTQVNGQPICVPNYNTQCPSHMVQVGNNSDGTANCAAPNCPAGTYLYGMSGGSPMCSNDRYTSDTTCPSGQSVTGITNGVVTCSQVNATLGPCTKYEVGTGNNSANAGGYAYPDYTGDKMGPSQEQDPYTAFGWYSRPARYVNYENHPAVTGAQGANAYWGMQVMEVPTREKLSELYELRAVHNRSNEVVCFNDTDYSPAAAQHEGSGGSDPGGTGPGGSAGEGGGSW